MDKLNKKQIIDLLPHREPMLLIDELYDIKKLSSSSANQYSLGSIGGFSGYVEIPNQIKEIPRFSECAGSKMPESQTAGVKATGTVCRIPASS